MVGFVFGLAFMLEEMQREANGARFIGGHFVNSADKMSKFAWHVDDHDEDEPGGSYIEHSVLTMCSLGASSIAFAPIGEVHYEGPGSIIKFRAWTPHRSALVKPEPAKAAMWKFASFYAGESSADFEEVTADDETGTDQSVRHDDEESPYYYTVLTGSAAYEDYAPWLRAQLVAGNLRLGQLVTQGGDAHERKNHCQGLTEMGKARRACSAMARLLPVGKRLTTARLRGYFWLKALSLESVRSTRGHRKHWCCARYGSTPRTAAGACGSAYSPTCWMR